MAIGTMPSQAVQMQPMGSNIPTNASTGSVSPVSMMSQHDLLEQRAASKDPESDHPKGVYCSYSKLLLIFVFLTFLLSVYGAVVSTLNYLALSECSCVDTTEELSQALTQNAFPCEVITSCYDSGNVSSSLCSTIDAQCELQPFSTKSPSSDPTPSPSTTPSQTPTAYPSPWPSAMPSADPSRSPSIEPTMNPSSVPTNLPTVTVSSNDIIPRNSIVIWNDCSNIPSGWTLCDGTSNTPDLSGKFVVGAGGGFTQQTTGGSADHSHSVSISGTVSSHTLSINEIPSHSHRYNSEFKYFVRIRADNCGTEEGVDCADANSQQFDLQYVGEEQYRGGGGSHSHGHNIGASADTVSNVPPYYVVCYITKTNTQYWINGQH